jgi:hypothetical protein
MEQELDMKLPATLGIVFVVLAGPAVADERADHYAPVASDTLPEAVTNFTDYNAMMADILARETLGGQDMEDIHQLTYTLETALARMIADAQALAVTLEEVHLASEGSDPAALRTLAQDYLDTATVLSGN